MAVALLTYHAQQSWMPDRPQGFVRRGEGILPPDDELARQYRQNTDTDAVTFDANIQRLLINAVMECCTYQGYRLHCSFTDATHVHVLVSWRSSKRVSVVRQSIKQSLTRYLNRHIHRRNWLARKGSQKRVKDRDHFEYLMRKYILKHSGWKWREDVGVFH
ncbi:hypothetical protein HED60_03515 [Planctomycetales bacterium ZRK34]|nr:hypothetical protein HED60_03515 [Planctomycetales bacterium ZRK34]